jgi:hypothetical protein
LVCGADARSVKQGIVIQAQEPQIKARLLGECNKNLPLSNAFL